MATTTHDNDDRTTHELVDPAELVCAGCADAVACAPPLGWPATAGAAPMFSHRDGSVLCPDSRGRVGEPVEPFAVTA